jgi:hypothetical protein
MDNLKTKTTSFVDILYLHTLYLDNMHSTRQQALEIFKTQSWSERAVYQCEASMFSNIKPQWQYFFTIGYDVSIKLAHKSIKPF